MSEIESIWKTCNCSKCQDVRQALAEKDTELEKANARIKELEAWKKECLGVIEQEFRFVDICKICLSICEENQKGGCMSIACFDQFITAKTKEQP